MKIARFIAIILIILSVLTVATVITAKIYEKKLGPIVIKNINEQLGSEIVVSDVKFSILKKFPNASFVLINVYVKPNSNFISNHSFKTYNTDTLLKASSVFLEFNVVDLIKKHYNIKSIEVINATVNILIDKNGLENYSVWTKTKESDDELSIDLQNLTIKNLDLLFINQFKKYHAKARVKQLCIQGNFKKETSTLIAKGDVDINSLKINDINYKLNKNCSFNLNILKDTEKLQIENSFIQISGIRFNTKGEYNFTNEAYCDFIITADNTELNSLIHLLPKTQLKKLKNYAIYGNFSFITKIKGNISKKVNPEINVDFNLTNGSFLNNKTNIILNNLSLKGAFTNGNRKTLTTSTIYLKDVNFNIDSSTFSGNYSITNFMHPLIKIYSQINVDLSQVNDFFQFDTIKTVSGKLRSTLWFEGKFTDIKTPTHSEIQNIKLSGESFIKNASLAFINSKYLFENINAKVIYANTDLRISHLIFQEDYNKFNIEGLILNFFPFLFFENEKIFIDVNFNSANLELDRYFTKQENLSKEDSLSINLPENISFSIGLNIGTFDFSKFKAKNIKSILHYSNKVFSIENFSFLSMNGRASGNGELREINQMLEFKVESNFDNIDIRKMFYSFNNFGQQFIIDQNLKGQINGTIKFSGVWDNKLNPIEDKFFAEGDLTVNNGELIDFEPMQQLSKFAEVEELKLVKFSQLKNTIYIKERKVIIPDMQIISTAFNLGIAGEHTFDNEINYHINLLLSEVLSKKFRKRKKKDEEFTNIEDDGLGRSTLFLMITGTVDDYKISYDRKKARKKIKDDLKKEKQEIKNILKDEFSLFKRDTSRKKTLKRIKTNEEFIFKFEEDTL